MFRETKKLYQYSNNQTRPRGPSLYLVDFIIIKKVFLHASIIFYKSFGILFPILKLYENHVHVIYT